MISAVMRRLLPIVAVLGLIFSALAAAALVSQARAQTRGLDLGAPLNRPNIYGLNIHLLNVPDQSAQLDRIAAAGFVWVRQPFDWQTTDLAAADSLVAAIAQRHLHLVAVLTGSRPPDPAAFTDFAAQFAARYGKQIGAYQIWDEPNIELGWNGPPSAAEYARLLQAAYTAIHAADPGATVLLAGLAPTIETGPKNISDVLYLRQLYALGAGPYFDAAAGKPYGFDASPYDRAVDPNVLDFSRLILLREEMIAHGDSDKFLWGSNFGWNTRPSIWGHVSAEQQAQYSRQAYDRAANEWPWAGPLFLQTPEPSLPADDSQWGFAVPDLRVVTGSFSTALKPGRYAAQDLNAYAIFFDGAWQFSDLGADIPQTGPATITFNFIGTDLALTLRRADYRAYLFVTIDGRPANALPTDSSGQAYVILTSPDLQPRTDTIPLAAGLAPGPHIAVIRADRGWDQWAIVAVTVGPSAARPDLRWPLALLVGIFIMCAAESFISLRKVNPSAPSALSAFQRFSDLGQTAFTAAVAALLWASAWLTWGNDLAQTARKYGDTAPLLLTLLTAGLAYYSPSLLVTLLSLAALFILFCLRPELALPLIALAAPFYLLPRPLWDRAFSMVEVCTVLAVAATLLRLIFSLRNTRRALPAFDSSFSIHHSSFALDLSVLAFVLVSAASALTADVRGVALRELRVVIVEPALLYLLFRLLRPGPKTLWRTADFFLLGAVLVALIGLGNYVTHTNLITAEGGVARIRSVFGSPNNLGLYLERAFPVAVSLALMGRSPWRRALYALATLPIAAAILLSFSKGALLLGVPAAVVVVLLFWGGRRAAIALAALTGAAGLAIIPLSRNPRFAGLFNLTSGTSFFRVQLWRSALAMWADHPLLGVGPDNFLYAYRGKYILPEAWQEPNLPHAHNFVLDALTRLGLLGLASFAAMLVFFFQISAHTVRALAKCGDDDLRPLAIGLLAGMVAALAHGLVDTTYWFVDLAFAFMLTLGLMASLHRLSRD